MGGALLSADCRLYLTRETLAGSIFGSYKIASFAWIIFVADYRAHMIILNLRAYPLQKS